MKKRGKFIVIEGIDGSGKTVQTGLLVEGLKKRGYRVEKDDYPHYDSGFWGRHAGRMLKGEFGDPMVVSPYLTALPYMLDEAEGSRQIRRWQKEGVWVVSNRFFTSNVHQIAKMPEDRREEYGKWLWEAGYGQMEIEKPDLVIVLLVDQKICYQNVLQKAQRSYTGGEAMDMAEKDVAHQMAAAVEYRRMVKDNPGWWVAIECCREGKLLSPEAIHGIVMEELGKKLNS